MKTVLITGSNGQLGEACKLNLRSKFNLILSDRKILNKPTFIDITKKDSVKNAIDYHQPNVVLNLAAYTDVDGCEKSIETSENINLNGLKNICKYFNGHIIQISTDYVFDGMSGPYHEEDRTNPLSVYGKHKLAAEEFLINNSSNYTIIRTNVLYGGLRSGASFLYWIVNSLSNSKKINIVNDQWNNPTSTYSLVKFISYIIENSIFGLYHYADKGIMNRYDFAILIAKSFDLDQQLIKPITSSELNQLAPRPMKSGLLTKLIEQQLEIEPPSVESCLENIRKKFMQ